MVAIITMHVFGIAIITMNVWLLLLFYRYLCYYSEHFGCCCYCILASVVGITVSLALSYCGTVLLEYWSNVLLYDSNIVLLYYCTTVLL